MDSIRANQFKDSGYMDKRESLLSDLTEYLDQNSSPKIKSDPMNQSQLSEAIYEQIPNAAYVSERSADEDNQLGGTQFSSAPIIIQEVASKPAGQESRKPKESSNDDGRKSRSSLASDSVFPRTGINNTA